MGTVAVDIAACTQFSAAALAKTIFASEKIAALAGAFLGLKNCASAAFETACSHAVAGKTRHITTNEILVPVPSQSCAGRLAHELTLAIGQAARPHGCAGDIVALNVISLEIALLLNTAKGCEFGTTGVHVATGAYRIGYCAVNVVAIHAVALITAAGILALIVL